MSPRRRTTRRDFLKGRSAAESLADATQGSPPAPARVGREPGAQSSAPGRTWLIHVSRRAMACQFEVILNAGQYPQGQEASVAALDLVDALEGQLSVYRPASEICHINRHAFDAPVPVEPRLFSLLRRAAAWHARTQGAFDVTAGPLSKVWGFFRRAGSVPAQADLNAALARVGSGLLEFDEAAGTLRFARQGMEINLGAIGKGFALDRAAEQLAGAGVHDFLMHGGQSSVLARGSRQAGPEAPAGWTVGVRHPLRPERRVVEVYLRDRALGTSGSGTQFFIHEGRRYGHVLDPRTGTPAEGLYSATAITPSAADADALATALYVLGREKGAEFCAAHPELGAILVGPGARNGSVDVAAFNLDADAWRRVD